MIQEQLDNGIPLHELKQKYGTQTYYRDGEEFKPALDGTVTEEDFNRFGIKT